MPWKDWAPGEEVLEADFQPLIMDQTVPRFATTAERDAAWSAAPPNGALCFVTGVGWQRRHGGSWGTYLDGAGGLLPVQNGLNVGTIRGGSTVVTTNANGTFTVAHGLGVKPAWYIMQCGDRASAGLQWVNASNDGTATATNLDGQAVVPGGAGAWNPIASKNIRVLWLAGV